MLSNQLSTLVQAVSIFAGNPSKIACSTLEFCREGLSFPLFVCVCVFVCVCFLLLVLSCCTIAVDRLDLRNEKLY